MDRAQLVTRRLSTPTVAAPARPTLVDRVLLRAGNPLDWCAADKTLLAALAIWPFTVWFWCWENILLRRPDLGPYFDRPFLALAFKVQTVFVLGWLTIAMTALGTRRRAPDSWVLPFVTTQFYSLGFGAASYYQGHYTSPFGGILCLVGAFTMLLLFERWIAFTAIGSFLVVVAATTLGEQSGVLPYAPIFAATPVANHRIDPLFVVIYGGTLFGALLVGLLLCYYIVDRWRDRDLRLAQTSEQLARASELVSRYVAAQVAEQIFAGNYSAVDKHDRRKLAVFFSDIKGFSAMADRLEPEETSQLLNEYLSEMTAIARRYGATVDKFIGDALMVFFGAPLATEDRDHALRAVRMGIAMQQRVADLSAKWTADGLLEEPFQIRIGINSGVASVGNFGSVERVDYTAIGRQVNLAARLQVNCEPGNLLISHSTWVLVRDQISCTEKSEIRLKGMERPVKVYEVSPTTAFADAPSGKPPEGE